MAIAKFRTNEGLIFWWVSWKVISYVFMPQNAVNNIIDLFKKVFDRFMESKSNEGY